MGVEWEDHMLPQALEIIKELQEYIGATEDNKVSNLIKMMKKGIVIHHGSIPLKVRFLIEKFINLINHYRNPKKL